MRFRLKIYFSFGEYGHLLPVNYQYELSSWIYHTLANGDAAYSDWLHRNGYTKDNKQFRLFTFSQLQISKLRIEGDRLALLSDQATLYLSFLPERATEEFVKGLFASQSFDLGDVKSKVRCNVQSVELVEPPIFEPTMTFQTLSPIVLSGHLPDGKPTYISPETPDITQIIFNNLCTKYEAFYGRPFEGYGETEAASESQKQSSVISGISFELIAPLKRKKITIKAGTPQQTYIVGYMTRFRISLPAELMRIMYETGIGEKGSMGFGMVEKI
jgi:CRISPR-associated endoribonuclease Cas6